MIPSITSASIPSIADITPASTGSPTDTKFAAVLEAAVRQVETLQSDAGQQIQKFISGDSDDLHTTALAVQKSELQFEMFLQVRNKVIQAYQEIMRSQA